ncbi:uncharacterized protein K452DRAFT_252796, partial [Aplosporella prunicola CBS 121167]
MKRVRWSKILSSRTSYPAPRPSHTMADATSSRGNLTFETSSPDSILAPRIGKLSIPGRATLDTPHYVGYTSRGVIPHLTQDMLRKNTDINSMYLALEDFIEKAPQQTPPVFNTPCPTPDDSPLRRFAALPSDALLVLGPRRVPPIQCPGPNTNASVAVHTSVGFSSLTSAYYASAAQALRPDIVVGLGDIMYGHKKPSLKRMDKMGDRTTAWTRDMVAGRGGLDKTTKDTAYNIFAPILPIDREMQSWYLNELVDELRPHLSGLALYDAASLAQTPEDLAPLPRLSLGDPATPHALLHEMALGMDLFTVPFITAVTDAGIAFSFTFPPTEADTKVTQDSGSRLPLGIDMWNPSHATALAPLQPSCPCHACTAHHCAYIHHLLHAKEMLGWVLLQVHNHSVLDRLFSAARAAIADGTFEDARAAFAKVYEPTLPEKTGQGPRVRGYQYKSDGPAEPKRNPPAYRMLDAHKDALEEDKAEGAVPDKNDDASD